MSILERGRRAAESRMTSRATVRRKTGVTTQDPGTGREVPVWETVHTGLSFRLGSGSSSDGGSRGVTVGGVVFEEATAVGHFPADTTNLQDGDFLDVAGEWAGVWRVVAAIAYNQKTARRIPIVEDQRPSEWDA